jgi:hypothetical protein
MAYEYDLSDAPTFRCDFAVDGVATDPTTISLTIRTPSGTETTYTYADGGGVTKAGTGIYTRQVTLSERGIWFWRWVGTGTCQSASEGTVRVRA